MKISFVVKALVLDSDGYLLLLRRSKTHPTMSLLADLPGGNVDPVEEPGDALVREIKEEIGLEVTKNQANVIYAGTNIYDDTNWVRLLYVVRLSKRRPSIVVSSEHDSAEWVSLNNLEQLETEFHSFYHDALHHINEHKLL